MSAAPPPPRGPVPMRASRRELDAFTPGAAWDLSRYVPWMADQAARRGASHILLVIGARGCEGCETLKAQLDRRAQVLGATLVIHAEAGELRGTCFFGVELGGWALRFPGVPTALLLEIQEDALTLRATALGPLDPGQEDRQLAELLAGRAHLCRDATGARLRLTQDGQERAVDPLALPALRIERPRG